MSRPGIKDATRHVFRGDFVPGLHASITEVWLSGDIETGIDWPGITEILESLTAIFTQPSTTQSHAPCRDR